MSKKVLLLLFVFAALLLGGFFIFSSGEEEITESEAVGETESRERVSGSGVRADGQSGSRSSGQVTGSQVSGQDLEPGPVTGEASPRELTDEEIEEIDGLLSDMEDKWDEEMEKLFVKELNLSKSDFEDYMVMREGFEEDRIEAFQEFHDEMADKNGGKYSYSPTAEMSDNERKIRKDYLDLFRKRFGEEAYEKYRNKMESFNDSIRRKSDPRNGVLNIDF